MAKAGTLRPFCFSAATYVAMAGSASIRTCSAGCGSLRLMPCPCAGLCSGNVMRIFSGVSTRTCRTMCRASSSISTPVSGLAHFHAPPDPGDRNRVADHMQRHVSFDIHGALMQPVDFGNPCRQRLQMHPLCREQFPRHGTDMLLLSRVNPVAPLARLLVQIVPV